MLFTENVILNTHSALGRYNTSHFNVRTVGTYNCHHSCAVKYLEIKYDIMKIVSRRIIIEL